MYIFCVFAIIIHGVLSITPCQDGARIVAQVTNNPEDLLGNWTYVYHWDPKLKFDFLDSDSMSLREFIESEDIECPQLHFKEATPEFIEKKKAECSEEQIPFNWDDVKLRVDAPVLKMDGGMIIIGEKENWMAVDCATIVSVVIKKVNDYVAMESPDGDFVTELLVKEPPTLEELKCVAHNLDVPKGMLGFQMCEVQEVKAAELYVN